MRLKPIKANKPLLSNDSHSSAQLNAFEPDESKETIFKQRPS